MRDIEFKKIIREFLNGKILKESNEELPIDDTNLSTVDSNIHTKEELNQELQQISNQNSSITKQASELLNKISSSSQTWNNVFNAVEELRKDFRSSSSLDSTADNRQVGMASVLLILFELVIQTNLRIQPVDINIIINTLVDNFNDESQIEALEKIIDTLKID